MEFNEKNLAAELETAVQEDHRRKQVDDMKKRSVMTARSYDEFRHLVACAEDGQKPVSSKEMEFLGNPGKRIGYMYAHERSSSWRNKQRGTRKQRGRQDGVKVKTTSQEVSVPVTAAEFDRFWRRKDLDDLKRLKVLLQIDPDKVFKVELNDLGGIIKLVHEYVEKGNENLVDPPVEHIMCFLEKLSTVERFSLAVNFLTSKEKEMTRALVETLTKLEPKNSLAARFAL
uniref:Dynein attachment factor N-terminal domain-containing protein n=1 Tax=Mucochytrium quahogii TaxID=96639 RepID=A0A7S2SKD7_9STRA|mmetsp:Transcript_8758/g.14188  ORF Transcript_8758/g.14188 Transcript_8758/m.14188 type:complete len:229 (+) Transcript_8758:155-841(+)